MWSSICLTLFLAFFQLIECTPYEAYPVSKQYPPVARIDEAFTFQLSNDTYKSSTSNRQISYKVYGLPDWLTFDTATRTMSGTPSSSVLDNGIELLYFNFWLEGFDASDNTYLNNTYQLVVTNYSSIELANDFNLLALLKNYGVTNGQSALILSPNEIFNITFARSTFTENDKIVDFYGRSDLYNAPLPNWVFFDQSTLKFSGTAPVVNSQIAPEVFYNFALIATDIPGYTGIKLPFQLVVGAHQLTTTVQNTLAINITDNRSFNYSIPMASVNLDGEPIQNADLGSIQLVDSLSWVKLENQTLSGILPDSIDSANFSLAIYDKYGDVVYMNFEVLSTTSLFAVSVLPNINATRGEWFQYAFLPSQFTNYSGTNVSVSFPNSSQSHSWLNFISSNLTLMGDTPESFDSLEANLVATMGSVSQKLSFDILGMNSVVQSNHTKNSTNSSHTSTSSSSHSATSHSLTETASSSSAITNATSTTSNSEGMLSKKSSNKTTVAIACGVVIPVVVIAILIVIFLFYWRHRKNERKQQDTEKAGNNLGPDDTSVDLGAAALSNPFDDDNTTESSSARRLGALNALKLDQNSFSGSDNSTLDEKMHASGSDDRSFYDANSTPSTEHLLGSTEPWNDRFRSSSIYLNNEPALRKSWKYNPDKCTPGSKAIRDSSMSLNTISTAEFLNTSIKDDQPVFKDPRKSSLGLRDSVFAGNHPSSSPSKHIPKNDSLPVVDEQSSALNTNSNTSVSSSSSDEFIPVKEGDHFNWVQRQEPNRRPSKKRLIDLSNKSNVDVGQVDNFEGHSPEQI